jgi:hypothetical protein
MSSRSSLLKPASDLWCWVVVLLLAMMLQRMERQGGGASRTSSLNKYEFTRDSNLAKRSDNPQM